jgi:hypothetical protein
MQTKFADEKQKSRIVQDPFELMLGFNVETRLLSATRSMCKRLSCEVQAASNSPSGLNFILEIGKFFSIIK